MAIKRKTSAKKSTKKKAATPKKNTTKKTTTRSTVKRTTSTRKSTPKTTTKKTTKRASARPTKKTSGKSKAKKKSTKSTKGGKSKPPKTGEYVVVPVNIKDHYDKKGGHPHVIIEDIENKHVSVGLTSDLKKGKNATNYTCHVNPLGGTDTSYMHRQGTVDLKTNYKNLREGNMEENDFKRAQVYGQRAKEKYLNKK